MCVSLSTHVFNLINICITKLTAVQQTEFSCHAELLWWQGVNSKVETSETTSVEMPI